MKIKILKENFPNEMPSGPSLGQPGPLGASMPEMKRKIMLLVDRIGKALDELAFYDNAFDYISHSFINLKPDPKLTKPNQYGERFFVKGPDGEIVYETLEDTALEKAQNIIHGRGGTNVLRFKKEYGKVISHATKVSELLEEVNHFIVLLESLEPDREVILYAKKIIYSTREVKFKYAGTYLSSLDNYGDYLAATGLAIESLSKIIPDLTTPGLGNSIKAIAEAFTENYKSLWTMISEELIDSGDVIPSRRGFLETIQPEVLKYMMRVKKPISPNDLLDDGFMDEMIKKYPLANTKARIRSAGTGRVLLRKAFNSLFEKGYIIVVNRDDPFLDTEFVINPEMAQKAGEEYFPKPEGIMENKKMKIKILKEATGEQKRQQKSAEYVSRQNQTRKVKARIIRSQNRKQSSYKNEHPDLDPIKDIGKIMKQRNKDLQVYANGEEIED